MYPGYPGNMPIKNPKPGGLNTRSIGHLSLEAVREKFQQTNLTMPNNFSYMKYALKSVPGLADVGVLHGDGDGPRTQARCLGGQEKVSNN